MRVLLLHFQAPLMSFGGPQVDHIGPTGRFPTVSQVTGLFGNALGYRHGEAAELQVLQDRVLLASVLLRPGEEVEDYQTVDLGQEHLRNPAWTTRGRTEHRDGGRAARYGTHIRLRRYRADASVLSAVSLASPDAVPTVEDIARALDHPARPLSLGRRTCVPADRIVLGVVPEASDLMAAIRTVESDFPERWSALDPGDGGEVDAEWPAGRGHRTDGASTHRVVDQRDWATGLHGGERRVSRGRVAIASASTASGETA